jgi:hypothetical protein
MTLENEMKVVDAARTLVLAGPDIQPTYYVVWFASRLGSREDLSCSFAQCSSTFILLLTAPYTVCPEF